jgi:branched-subunit amino acid aminotransferase/4-amino-4-deoxychorismate lyase
LRCCAEQLGAGEALITTHDGIVVEGALSAVVWWQGGTLCVPDPKLPVLDSVTRRLVLALAEASGTPVEAVRARLPDLDGCEVWTLSALHGIRPVTGWLDCELRAGPASRSASWRQRLGSLATPIRRPTRPGGTSETP